MIKAPTACQSPILSAIKIAAKMTVKIGTTFPYMTVLLFPTLLTEVYQTT